MPKSRLRETMSQCFLCLTFIFTSRFVHNWWPVKHLPRRTNLSTMFVLNSGNSIVLALLAVMLEYLNSIMTFPLTHCIRSGVLFTRYIPPRSLLRYLTSLKPLPLVISSWLYIVPWPKLPCHLNRPVKSDSSMIATVSIFSTSAKSTPFHSKLRRPAADLMVQIH